MTYTDLLARSQPGVSENGEIVYRVSPVETDASDLLMYDMEGIKLVGVVRAVPLPNSKRLCVEWIPSTKIERAKLHDAFVQREINKAVALIAAGTFKVEQARGLTTVTNTKTHTVCSIADNRATQLMCIQGQRCGLCKHKLVLVIRGDIKDDFIYETWLSMEARGEIK